MTTAKGSGNRTNHGSPRDMVAANAARRAAAAKRRDEGGFTEQERAFCLYYVGAANFVATDAALMTGWGKGKRSTAKSYAAEVMRRPHIRAEIERLVEERNAALNITAEDVLRKLLVLEVDAMRLNKSTPALKLRLDTIKAIGEHVTVGAFRRQVGLSAPNGGPIETVDLAALAKLSDKELDDLERARSIMDRITGSSATPADDGGDSSGEGEEAAGE